MHASPQVHMHASPAVHVDATHLSRQQHEQQVVGPREGTLQAPRLSLYVNLVLLLPYLQVGADGSALSQPGTAAVVPQ